MTTFLQINLQAEMAKGIEAPIRKTFRLSHREAVLFSRVAMKQAHTDSDGMDLAFRQQCRGTTDLFYYARWKQGLYIHI